MHFRSSAVLMTAALSVGLFGSPAMGDDAPGAVTPIEVRGGFVFRIDPNGDAVCRYEPDFTVPEMPMMGKSLAGAIDDPLFCRLYIDGILQPPYPGFPDGSMPAAAAAAVPAPGAFAVLMLAGIGATSRRSSRR